MTTGKSPLFNRRYIFKWLLCYFGPLSFVNLSPGSVPTSSHFPQVTDHLPPTTKTPQRHVILMTVTNNFITIFTLENGNLVNGTASSTFRVVFNNTKPSYFPFESWLVNRNPYVMVYEIIPIKLGRISSPI